MRIEQLRYFIEIAKTRSINVAAANLYMAQPTVSEAVKKLEMELDAELLERSHTGVTLTEAGQLILPIAQSIVSETETMLDVLKQLKVSACAKELTGELKVGTVASVSRTIIPPLTIQFNKRYPKIGLSVMTQSITCIHEEVKERRLDMGIIIAFPNEVEACLHDELVFVELSRESVYALVSSNSPLAEKKSVTPKELADYSLTVLAHDLEDNYLVEAVFSAKPPSIKGRTNNPDVFRTNILSGQMVGLILSPSLPEVRNEPEMGWRTIPIKVKGRAALGYLYHPETTEKHKIEAFAALLRVYLNQKHTKI